MLQRIGVSKAQQGEAQVCGCPGLDLYTTEILRHVSVPVLFHFFLESGGRDEKSRL